MILCVIPNDQEPILDKVQRVVARDLTTALIDEQVDAHVKSTFPGAMTNGDLVIRTVAILHQGGFDSSNTLLTTSLCSDELAKRLGDDFSQVYGNTYLLGGLAGFPFAGNIGFETMALHMPDDGFCFLVYGPHVGITREGVVGSVERTGVELVDDCCRSAIEAYNVLAGNIADDSSEGGALAAFMDLQQKQIQFQMEPFFVNDDRLRNSPHPMRDLPYALYEKQSRLVEEIITTGQPVYAQKQGIALLGGIQINTGPGLSDYFHPLRFDYLNNDAQVVANLLPQLMGS